MTEKLYYADSHLSAFEACVCKCGEENGRFYIILDRTAFFPGGGGQSCDSGFIGGAEITDVAEIDGEIVHYCAEKPRFAAPETVLCRIDWEKRFSLMQNHSGEHLFSGIAHTRFGCENVGFHMGEDGVTIDLDRELSGEDIGEIERAANEAVWKNVPVTARFPDTEELKTLEYRSKLELTENVRIVDIEGYDSCACCAPHVSKTGEIGLLKVMDYSRHRGGMRIILRCGREAMAVFGEYQASVAEISALLSVKRRDAALAVKRLSAELSEQKHNCDQIKREFAMKLIAESSRTEGNLCYFVPDFFEPESMRILLNEAVKLCGGAAAAFVKKPGGGYNYVIASERLDLRALAKKINSAISGRGGGSKEMIQGSALADEKAIRAFFDSSELFGI
jgi:alanyl-tRNA synthetase